MIKDWSVLGGTLIYHRGGPPLTKFKSLGVGVYGSVLRELHQSSMAAECTTKTQVWTRRTIRALIA
eukprot:SAG31_NODE_1657_length_7619_cov_10.364362_6_plen_66_part_00